MERKNFGKVIGERRKGLGLSLQDVANIARCTPSYIVRMEKGEKDNPTIPFIYGIATALKLDFHELVDLILEYHLEKEN